MADPIEAHYTPDGDDWTVAVTGRGRTLTGRAPGLIAARDRADQLVEQLAPEESGHKTVVHLLNGDAVEFTTAYLTARLARSDEPASANSAEAGAERPAEDTTANQSEEVSQAGEGPAGDKGAGKPETGDKTEAEAAGQAGDEGPAEEADPAPPRGPVGAVKPVGPNSDVTGARGPVQAAGPANAAEDQRLARRPTPRPRTESQAAQPAATPAKAPEEETAPSGH